MWTFRASQDGSCSTGPNQVPQMGRCNARVVLAAVCRNAAQCAIPLIDCLRLLWLAQTRLCSQRRAWLPPKSIGSGLDRPSSLSSVG